MSSPILALEQGTFQGFPCYTLMNEYISATVVPELGGRIMAFGKSGGDNLLYVFPDLMQKKAIADRAGELAAEALAAFRKRHPPIHYGGHKNWLSPYESWDGKPFLDLDNGAYTVTEKTVSPEAVRLQVTSPVCRETGMSFTRTIELKRSDPRLHLDQQMINSATEEARFGLWDVTQLNNPSIVYYGVRQEQSRHSGGIKMFYSGESALPAYVRSRSGTVSIECGRNASPAKFGSDTAEGWIVSRHETDGTERYCYFLKSFPVFGTNSLPDDCMVEIYLFPDIPCAEAEVLSPIVVLPPGGRFGFGEIWRVMSCDRAIPDDEIADWVRNGS